MQDLAELLVKAPVLVTVWRGEELHLEFFNLYTRKPIMGGDMTGETLPARFPQLGAWLGKIAAVVRTGEPYIGVGEALELDWSGTGKPETRYVTLICKPVRSAAGSVDACVMLALDVTESALARGLSRGEEGWLQAALDSIATPVVLAEPGTRRIIFSNAAARALSHGDLPSGTTFGQAIGLDTGYFCTDATGARIPEEEMPASRASRGEVVDAMELQWHTPFGMIPLVCFAEIVPGTPSLPRVVVLSFFDASRARRLERELLEAEAARDVFLSLASHELRTPLTALQLQVQALRRQYPEAHGLAAVEHAARRMDTLVEQLLDTARIRQAGVTLEPEELDIGAVLDEVIERLRGEARRAGSTLARVGAASMHGRWDRVRLRHVFTNLVCNAMRFGAGAPIRIECRDLGDRISVAVVDAGVGVDPADHERIFQRYGRAASERHFGGLGLGLWITREIVAKMGGSITVRSALGQGATFTVELPKAPPADRGRSGSPL